jgi:hypothetical protein
MTFLKRDAILAAQDLAYEDVEVPQWGGTVRIRALTAYERDSFERENIDNSGDNRDLNTANMRARLVARCMVDETGARVFGDGEALELGKKHGAIVDKLFWIARRLSAFTDAELEALVKNSAPGLSGAVFGASA